MIRSLYRTRDGNVRRGLASEELARAVHDPCGLVWVSLENATDDEIQSVLGDLFRFHPLTVEDCLSRGHQASKLDDFSDYLFVVTHTLSLGADSAVLETAEIDVFLTARQVVSCHRCQSVPALEAIWSRVDSDHRPISHGADLLLQAILDAVVDSHGPVLDAMDEEIDRLEDEVLAGPTTETLRRILDLKHSSLILRRVVGPQREIANRLSRDEFRQIEPAHRIYFRDVYDHLVRMHDLSESLRDVIFGALETYISVSANRTNEVMKVLTIVATLFMPLTFLAGVYGMNFRHMPELAWRYGYGLSWLAFVLIAIVMWWYFRRKGWL